MPNGVSMAKKKSQMYMCCTFVWCCKYGIKRMCSLTEFCFY